MKGLMIFALATVPLAGPVAAQGMYGNPSPYARQSPAPASNAFGGYGNGSNPQSQGVQGYPTHNGGYVQPYERTVPNGTQTDNYGTRGNVNPYTGAVGARPPRY